MANPKDHQLVEHWEGRVAMGHYTRLRQVEKFARNPVISTSEEDLWPLGGVHTDLSTGTTVNISSNDDTANQTIRVFGIDGDWKFHVKDVVLTGQTPTRVGALLGWTNIVRAFQVSAAPEPLEDVYFAIAGAAYTLGVPDNLNQIVSYIDYGADKAHQTEQGWAQVPADSMFLLYQMGADLVSASSGSARSAEILLEVSELAKGATVSNPSWSPYRRIHDLSVSTGHSRADENWRFPQVFQELTRISLRGIATANSELAGEFKGLILPKHT